MHAIGPEGAGSAAGWGLGQSIKNAAIFGMTRAAIGLAGQVPLALVPIAGTGLGLVAWLVAGRERRMAVDHIHRSSLAAAPRDARRLARRMFAHLGMGAIELARLRAGRSPGRADLPDADRRALDGALAEGRGVIYVTGHVGNWEIMAWDLAKRGYPVSTLAAESYDPRFTSLADRFRRGLGVEPIYRDRPGTAAAMLRALRRGRVLGFLVDQKIRAPSVEVSFLGRNAPTVLGPARLALRTGAPVVVGTCQRVGNACHRTRIARIAVDPRRDTAESLTQRFSTEIEDRIGQAAEQWVWMHQRWND